MTGAGARENDDQLADGVVLLGLGLVSSRQTQAEMRRRGVAA